MTREVVAVIALNPEDKFVILKRVQTKTVHANLWNLPSGGVEEGETVEEASKREVLEETGLTVDGLKIGSTELVETPTVTLNINYILGRTISDQVKLNAENSEYRWVTPRESLDYQFAVSKETVKRILQEFELL